MPSITVAGGQIQQMCFPLLNFQRSTLPVSLRATTTSKRTSAFSWMYLRITQLLFLCCGCSLLWLDMKFLPTHKPHIKVNVTHWAFQGGEAREGVLLFILDNRPIQLSSLFSGSLDSKHSSWENVKTQRKTTNIIGCRALRQRSDNNGSQREVSASISVCFAHGAAVSEAVSRAVEDYW